MEPKPVCPDCWVRLHQDRDACPYGVHVLDFDLTDESCTAQVHVGFGFSHAAGMGLRLPQRPGSE